MGGMARSIFSMLFVLATASCDDAFEYSPNQVFDDDSSIGLNGKYIDSLLSTPPGDTIAIAFVGDTQRFYAELDAFVDKVNHIHSLDFLVLAGDISDFGLLEEYEQVNKRLKRINKPFISIIGNHDVLAKGEETFERMYGPLDFSFQYGNIKFIAHNNNSREYEAGKVPDMNWLRQQFDDDSAEYIVPVSHMPPFASEFDSLLLDDYISLFREHKEKVLISLHGHVHTFKDGYFYEDGVRYMTTPSFDKRNFVLLKIYNGTVYHEIIDY